jgi:hypothetical protein
MTDQTTAAAARFDRRFMLAIVPALLFMLVSLYVRVTTKPDPLWSEFATPLFFALIGVRALLRPAPPAERKFGKGMGALLILAALLMVGLALSDFQGA